MSDDALSTLPDDLSRDSSEPPADAKPDGSVRDDLRCIADVLPQLGRYEVRGLRLLAERLLEGQHRYGQFDPQDGRDWKREAAEEMADMLWYGVFCQMTRWWR